MRQGNADHLSEMFLIFPDCHVRRHGHCQPIPPGKPLGEEVQRMRGRIGTLGNGRMRFALHASLGAILLATVPAGMSFAKSPREIDTSVDVSLERFYQQVKGAKEFAGAAKGLLVMAKGVKAGSLVGGQ